MGWGKGYTTGRKKRGGGGLKWERGGVWGQGEPGTGPRKRGLEHAMTHDTLKEYSSALLMKKCLVAEGCFVKYVLAFLNTFLITVPFRKAEVVVDVATPFGM